jgi:CheR methyltransferase, SAM binding domain
VTRRDLFTLAVGSIPLYAQVPERAVYLPLDDARPVLESFSGELPAGLDSSASAASWLKWETARDLEIRARLQPGDADSIVNLLLFGTSFTSEARLSGTHAEKGEDDTEAAGRLIVARVRDFAKAVLQPGRNERMQFAAAWLKENGIDLADPAADKRVGVLLLENTRRVLREQNAHNTAIDAAKKSGDAGSLFVARSSLYRDRGLSLDTSFRPNYAIERTLAEIKSAGRLEKIRRAAVIGPGLDFMDKRSGYDFYPIQTLQPFALVDSLRRLRMTEALWPSVAIIDLSARVLNHVRLAVTRARQGSAYTVQVPLDRETRWLPETTDYWQRFGSGIGSSVPALTPPPGVDVRMRAVKIGPDVVKLLRPADLNIVLEHLPLPEDRKLDLIIATNVMVYYEPFEQGLALQNIAGMLRKGGMLLTNNALPEVKGVPIRPAGGSSIAYSEDPDDGDHVVWYQRV